MSDDGCVVWDGHTVGPADMLVLSVRDAVSQADVEQIKTRIPEALRGRVLVTSGADIDTSVVKPRSTAQEDLIARMSYHPATPDTAPKFDALRSLMLATANEALLLVPDGREQALMVTHLEEALMWGSKAIAMTTPVDHSHPDVARVLPGAFVVSEDALQPHDDVVSVIAEEIRREQLAQ